MMLLVCTKILILIIGIPSSLQNQPILDTNLPPARQMALAILQEAERRPEPEAAHELENEDRAKTIIKEVNEHYLNIAKKLNELEREEGRLHSLQKRIKRRRRIDLLRNLRKHYTN